MEDGRGERGCIHVITRAHGARGICSNGVLSPLSASAPATRSTATRTRPGTVPLPYSSAESESIGLCIAVEAIDDMANHALLVLSDIDSLPGQAEVRFAARMHQDLFLSPLLDFVHEKGDSGGLLIARCARDDHSPASPVSAVYSFHSHRLRKTERGTYQVDPSLRS